MKTGYENVSNYSEEQPEQQNIWFLLIIDKENKKYYLQRTSYLDAFESIYLRKNKELYAMMIFSNKFSERVKRISFIKGLRRDNFRFKKNLLNEFLLE
nr:MAG TPA: hypothetical protein [Caudoviricetes sp.]